jgi:hypothetical protein
MGVIYSRAFMGRAHFVGQVWHLKEDERFSIHLMYCGYSVPMYCCYFCHDYPDRKMLAACHSLDKAWHAIAVLKAEHDASLQALTVTNS